MRRWLKFMGGIAAGIVLLLVTLPFWLGTLLPPIARLVGARIGHYERIGYARFAISQAEYRLAHVRISAARLEADTPALWCWRHVRGADSTIEINGWSVIVEPSPAPAVKTANGMAILHSRLGRIIPRVAQVFPQVHLRSGAVRWPGGGLTLADAEWRAGVLRTHGLSGAGRQCDMTVTLADSGAIEIDASQSSADLRFHARWTGREAEGLLLVGSQPVRLQGRYGETGWLPEEGEATADDWRIPAARSGLGEEYVALHGNGRATWKAGRFQIAIEGAADPKPGSSVVPVQVKATASGSSEGWSVTALDLRLPFARVRLSGPVTFNYGTPGRFTPAHLDLDGSLDSLSRLGFEVVHALGFQSGTARSPSGLSWLLTRGHVAGGLDIVPGSGAAPQVRFSLEATDIDWRDIAASRVSLKGSWESGRLTVQALEAHLDGNGLFDIQGICDFKTHTLVSATVRGRLGPDGIKRFLPAKISASTLEFSGEASGPWDSLRHSGTLRVTGLQFPRLQPLEVNGAWKGRGLVFTQVAAQGSLGPVHVDVTASADRDGLRLTDFRLVRSGSEIWSLAAPAEITWAPVARIVGFRLRGKAGEVAIDGSGGRSGFLTLAINRAGSSVWRDLVLFPGPDWTVRSLRFSGRMTGDRLVFSTAAEADIDLPGRLLHLSLSAEGDGSDVRLRRLDLLEGDRVVALASGHFPIGWNARGERLLNLDRPMEVRAEVEPESPFWTELARTAGLTLVAPAMNLRLSGTLRNPVGTLQAEAARFAALPGKFRWSVPPMDALALSAHADREAIVLDSFGVRISGQRISASGRLPMAGKRWLELASDRTLRDWDDAELRLDADRIDLAPVAAYWPDTVAARGRASAHLAFSRGNWSGSADVVGAATRPIGSLGIVQDIDAGLDLRGRSLLIRSTTATLGGQAIRLEGKIEAARGGPLRLALRLHGGNIPLVRKPGALVRADVDLRATTDSSGVTAISGEIALRDSLYLSELTDLLPNGAAGVSRPPPYVSIPMAPFNRWPVAVDVTGERSFRIRTAIFSGTASPRFKISGTLGEPRAAGEVRIDEGEVNFPFVSFQVQYGAIRLSQADPYRPTISLTAQARRYGYDLRMEARGPVESPTVTFTSNPMLDSGRVLFMVMAGQLDSTGTGGSATASTNSQVRLAEVGTYFGENLFESLGLSGGDRLTVSPGAQMSQKGHETYTTEYRLGSRWSLVGEYDEFDDYNLDFKWRAYRKGGAP